MQISSVAPSILSDLQRARSIAQQALADPSVAPAQLALGEHFALGAHEGFRLLKDFASARQARLGASYLGQAVDFRLMDATGRADELATWIRGASSAAVAALDVAIAAAQAHASRGAVAS